MNWGKGGGHNDDGGPWGSAGNNPGGNNGGPGNFGGGGRSPNDNDLEALLRGFQEKLRNLFSGDGGNRKVILIGLGVLLAIWLASGIYQVQPGQQAVVLRFGGFQEITGAGLHYRLPAPLESVEVINTQVVRKESFGTVAGQASSIGTAASIDDSLMLTGDENIIDITFDVQWDISNPQDYLFNVRNPDLTVRSVAESAMREVIGNTSFTRAQTEGKSQIEQDAKQLIQDTLNSDKPGSYKAGIRILSNLLEASAPGPVLDAVRDVQAARADQERSRNEAEAYRNEIIPRARGQAERMFQESDAYKQEVVARAQGDVARFSLIYELYKLAPDITRKRIYLETMERVMAGMNKVIMNENGNGVLPYMALPAIEKKRAEEEGAVP